MSQLSKKASRLFDGAESSGMTHVHITIVWFWKCKLMSICQAAYSKRYKETGYISIQTNILKSYMSFGDYHHRGHTNVIINLSWYQPLTSKGR